MASHCFKCTKEISVASDGRVGRRDSCPSCGSDLHCCRNCKFYSATSYNECSEPQADRVLEKDRSNFCDFFALGTGAPSAGNDKAAALKKLDDLFK